MTHAMTKALHYVGTIAPQDNAPVTIRHGQDDGDYANPRVRETLAQKQRAEQEWNNFRTTPPQEKHHGTIMLFQTEDETTHEGIWNHSTGFLIGADGTPYRFAVTRWKEA